MNTSHANSSHRRPTPACESAAPARPADEFGCISQWTGVRNVPASLRAYMFQIACAPPSASMVPRLDVLAAHATIGPVSSPQRLGDAYELILRHAPDFRIAMLEGLYRALIGCSGWLYVDRNNCDEMRKAILIGSEAIASGMSPDEVRPALGIRSRHPHAVLGLVSVLGTVAYRLPTIEPRERLGADPDLMCALADVMKFGNVCRACRLGPRHQRGYVSMNGFEEHNALVWLGESAAIAVTLACASAGIRFDTVCDRLRLPSGLRDKLRGRYLAAQAAGATTSDT